MEMPKRVKNAKKCKGEANVLKAEGKTIKGYPSHYSPPVHLGDILRSPIPSSAK
jgi:hypothetical protein